jgi:Sec-independent protein translocase protein TatA
MDINLSDILTYLAPVLTGAAGLFVGRRKKAADEKKAEAEAKGAEIENDEKAAKIILDCVVAPLKKEITAIRREVTKLRRAIEEANGCTYRADCPVRLEMQKKEEHVCD